MKRKVNLVGNNTLTVSLPSKWADKHNVKKGDEIELIEEPTGDIIISKNQSTVPKLKEIKLTISKNDSTHIRSLLGSIYRKGFDKIYLEYEGSEIYKSIVDSVNSLIGFEIIEFESNKCVIKNMILDENAEFEVTFRRMFFSLKWMNSILIENIESRNLDKLEDIRDMWRNVWKSRDFALRVLSKKNLFNEHTYDYFMIVWALEKMVSNHRKIYELLVKEPKKDYSNLTPVLKKCGNLIDLFEKSYYKKDLTQIHLFDEESEEIIKKSSSLFNTNKNNNLTLAHIINITRMVHDMKSFLVSILIEPIKLDD